MVKRAICIFICLSVFSVQSCYFFCFFRPETPLEAAVERFVEEEIEKLTEEHSDKKPS